MTDLSDAVQAALFAKLEAGVTLGKVLTIVPDNTQPPVAVIGDSQAEQIGGKGSDVERHEISIRTIVAGTSRRALFALMKEVKDSLHNQPISAPGATLSLPVMTSSDSYRDIEEKVLIGEQSFTVIAQPAP
jgi:hypothetical protein